MNTFSIAESIRFGWETFKKRPWFFIWTILVFNVLSGGFNFSSEDRSWGDMEPWTIAVIVLASIGAAVISLLAKMALNRFLLKAHDAPETVGFKENWGWDKFLRFLWAGLLKGAIIGVPALALFAGAFFSYPNFLILVPCVALGVAWMVYTGIRLMFVELVVMDSELTAVQSLRESEKITRGEFWHLVRFSLALAGVCILGLIALVVGLLVAIPVTFLAFVDVYKKLKIRNAAFNG